MFSYILASIDSSGYIRAEAPFDWNAGMGYTDNHYVSGQKSSMIHRETVNLDRQDSLRCFARLDMAKSAWEGPESDDFILGLNEQGAVEAIYCAPTQEPVVKNRLKIWSGCYGSWPVRTLNV